jgi:hypothetical protein
LIWKGEEDGGFMGENMEKDQNIIDFEIYNIYITFNNYIS